MKLPPAALVLLALPLLVSPGLGQRTGGGPSQADLLARHKKKLASAFLQKGDWFTDFDQAKAAAKREGKFLFGYFTRSFAP